MAKILIVEDDPHLLEMVSDWLKFEHHVVETITNGVDALNLMRSFPYDLVVLDINIPKLNGLEVLREFRDRGGQTPILMLTGKKEIEDKERGLNMGADDYLTKPFEARELSARIRAILRRPPAIKADILKGGIIELNPKEHVVTKSGEELQLAPREFALLEFLMRHPGEVFTAEALLNRVWESELEAAPETVRMCVTRLRNKLGSESNVPSIKTVFGVGYKLEMPE